MSFLYRTNRRRKQIIEARESLGETMKHDNFLPSGEKELIFEVRPIEPPDPVFILRKLLLGKLENNTMTFEQLKTLIRIEHGFPLTQTTRDKILIAIQGVVGTLRDRLKSVFGL